MGTPFMGEIKIVAFNFAPKSWALANGQFLPINQNQALFSLFGTMYGGNGQTTFALPDLRGRVPIHIGPSFTQGQAGGEEAHTITMSEMAAHNHFFMANSADGDGDKPQGPPKGSLGALNVGYNNGSNLTSLAPGELSNVGGSQPHENKQPYLVLNYCVALTGVFPSRN
ncbi:MAG: phage tail protein [Allosphingosinicella sp.]